MKKSVALGFVFAVVAAGMVLAGCRKSSKTSTGGQEGFTLPSDPAKYEPLKGYEAMKIPADNPITASKAELGWVLFFDKRLSGDGSRSCYACHLNDKGLSDGRPTAIGAFEKKLSRNSPVLWNIGYHSAWYWDGRATKLAAQAAAAWKGGNMGAKNNVADIVKTINGIAKYKEGFQKAFNGPATEENIPQALASYMRTIISQNTPWDKFRAGDKKALSEAAQRGWAVFQKAKCTNCHSGLLFTDQQFHNIGIGMKDAKPDIGRFKVTKIEKDTGAFKTPTLRDVGDSAPYFHNGSAATIEDAVKVTIAGGIDNPHLDKTNLQKVDLTDAEVKDLVTFLREGLDEPTKLAMPEVP